MALTVADAITKLHDIATEFSGDRVDAENGYITIIRNVSKSLIPHMDFEFNGELECSLPRSDFLVKYGNKLLSEISDFEKHDIKLCWSPNEITPLDEEGIFKLNLVLRLRGVDDENNSVSFVALRNKYSGSLVDLFYQKQ